MLPPDFNPHTQSITLLYPDGSPITISLAEIDSWTQSSIRVISIFSTQVGACAVVLFLLFALTKPEKRKTPIFIFNAFSLSLVIIRSVLQICYFTGGWYGFFTFWAYYFDDLKRKDYAISIAATVMALLLHICIMVSLVLQVRVVYASNPRLNKIMTMLAMVVSLASVGFFFAVTVQVSVTIMKTESYVSKWVYPTSRGLLAGAISFFSCVFVVKLGMAIHQRKILGLEKWGPLQVIFVVGCQTLVVPAIFSILENVNSVSFDGMSSLTTFLVAISLPISSLWASASVTDKSTISPPYNSGSQNSGTSSRLMKSRNTCNNKVRFGSVSTGGQTLVEKKISRANHYEGDEEKAEGINVERVVDVDLLVREEGV
ncbi:fungal pheromone mating factor STE2 GPCR-domain-containing protein [Tirmania nivea]|nr:fungal pheromone mating factor STE2 GPCR-domain-containing protein [Tirmania nivea]